MELILVPLCRESGNAGLVQVARLVDHLREPNFEHGFNLQKVRQISLTAKTQRGELKRRHLLVSSSRWKSATSPKSHPISGFCKIPSILCSLSMATLCWKLDKPAAKCNRINLEEDNKSRVWLHIRPDLTWLPLSKRPVLSPCKSSSKGRMNRCRHAHWNRRGETRHS